ncbi:MAG: helix-turn-helix domain-containing protein [Sodalis sp. (in: enterobacteria)]|uniref:helix-turn-helix domain-containing protein n=1 Tax=Sodalis sp. (in: enterobacteria) TaxID=1898979 RepID=UPI003F30B9C9
MRKRKTSNFAFDMDGKENFVARLKQLIGNRSARAAANEWGLSFSTLYNYLTRGTELSFTVVQGIAYKEHVSLDWLAFGSSCTQNEVASTSEI